MVTLQQLHDLHKVKQGVRVAVFNLRFGLGALILLLGILFFALLSDGELTLVHLSASRVVAIPSGPSGPSALCV